MPFFVIVFISKQLHLCIVNNSKRHRRYIMNKRINISNNLISLATLLLFCLISFVDLNAQGWERRFNSLGEAFAQDVIQTEDGGYLIVGYENIDGENIDMLATRIDVDGNVIWSKLYGGTGRDFASAVIKSQEGGFLIAGYSDSFGNVFKKQAYLIKIDDAGTIEWDQHYGGDDRDDALAVIQLDNSDYVFVGSTFSYGAGSADVYLTRIDNTGEVVWSNSLGNEYVNYGYDLIQTMDGGFAITGRTDIDGVNKNIYLLKTDATGDFSWSQNYGGDSFDEGNALVQTDDGGYLIAASFDIDRSAYIIRTDINGDTLWTQSYAVAGEASAQDIVKTTDGNYAVTGFTRIGLLNYDYFLLKINDNNDEIWSQTYVVSSYDEGHALIETEDSGFLLVGTSNVEDLLSTYNFYAIKTDSKGYVNTSYVAGNVYSDLNNSCDFQAEEIGLENWFIKVTGDNQSYFGTTDAQGNYSIGVDTGSYTVELIVANNYWEACMPTQTVQMNSYFDTTNVSFAVQSPISCPLMEIDVSVPFLQECEENLYTINYCNRGTAVAEDAYIELTIDQYLSFLPSSLDLPWTLEGNILKVELGDVAIGDCDVFNFIATLSCDSTVIGQAHCIAAHVYPDSICTPPDPNWNGASINVSGACAGDSVIFRIQNIGTGAVPDGLEYIITEDVVMGLNGAQPIMELAPQEEQIISLPATGATYRIIANQVPGHPGSSYPTLAIEGCSANNENFSVGYVNQFPDDDNNPFVSIDCQENLDINMTTQMLGYPTGYQGELITTNTDIEYHIRFQNTKTETAHRVVIRDTIPSSLDFTTARLGASSHPVDMEVYGNGILKFTFENILLPDSSTSQVASNGFVKFKISQKLDLAEGTVIDNSAAIYFDYSAPIITNVKRYVIGGDDILDFIEVISNTNSKNPLPGASVKVYPNPFVDVVTFEYEGPSFRQITLSMYDLKGQLIHRGNFQDKKFQIERGQLGAGMYLYRIEVDGQLADGGKVIVR